MTKMIFLTGISGYIGKHIALQLLQAGYHVTGSLRDLSRADEVRAALAPHIADLDQRLHFAQLDLTRDEGWQAALHGADVLIHSASPFPLAQPKNADDLIRPAVDGTLRALRAAQAAGISRVVLTSSIVAINGSDLPLGDTAYDETNWTDPNQPQIGAYVQSKTLAERAAWDFIATQAPQIGLTVINPGLVVGAPLDGHYGTSVAVVTRLLRGKDPLLPNIGFAIVDVADVAQLHCIAIEKPDTIGQRIMAVDRFMTFQGMALVLKSAYPKRKIPTRTAPDWLIRLLARLDPDIKTIIPLLGRQDRLNNARAMATLGRGMRQASKSITATADYLIAAGRV